MKKTTLFIASLLLLATAAPAFGQSTSSYWSYTTPAQPVYTCPQLWSNLIRGSNDARTSGQVSAVQRFFASRGNYQPVTGYYGVLTAANVAQFQREQGLWPVTGGVGPLTRAAIARVCGGNPVPPTPTSFSASPTAGQAPLGVTFSVNPVSGSDQNSLSIDFGDGQTGKPSPIYCFAAPCSPIMSASHTYTAAGTYTAKLLRDNNYCPPGMYCTLMYREPTVLGTVVITVTGSVQTPGVTAYPQYGPAPLSVTFTPNFSSYYTVDFGDGTSASLLMGPVQHTYWSRGTYTALVTNDAPCFHSNPRCMMAQQLLGSATITVY